MMTIHHVKLKEVLHVYGGVQTKIQTLDGMKRTLLINQHLRLKFTTRDTIELQDMQQVN